MLKAVFYARFHSERGSIIVHQYPNNVVQADKDNTGQENDSDADELITFQNVSSYIIPSYELCNRALSVSANGSTILGWPVSLEDPKYARNRFTFNVCFVLGDAGTVQERRSWDVIVRKTARWFKSLEEDSGILSSSCEDHTTTFDQPHDHEDDQVEIALQQIYEQLCRYDETCVRLSDSHVLNLRLDTQESVVKQEAKQDVEIWDVPLFIKELGDESVLSTDLALKQIRQHVNGVNHVRKISELADVELALVQSCLSGLLAREIVRLIDVFHFQAVYAQTHDMAWFVDDVEMQDECCHYIVVSDSEHEVTEMGNKVIDLYMEFRQGLSVAEFCKQNASRLVGLDIRRLITFGVIKGFLRRLQRYAIVTDQTQLTKRAQSSTNRKAYEDAVNKFEQAWKTAALSSGWSTPPADLPASLRKAAVKTADEMKLEQDEKLRSYLDGRHPFDQICVEMHMSEQSVMAELRSGRFGDVCFFLK